MKLTPKITLVFALYAAALLVSVAWLAYNSGKNSLRSATISELQSTAIEKQAALNEWIDGKREDIAILATSPSIVEDAMAIATASLGSPEAQAAHDRFVLSTQPAVRGGEFLVLMLLDPSSGQVIASTKPGEEGKFKENRQFFLNGKIGPYVQSVYYSISVQGPAMTAAAPVRSADGHLVGVLAGRLDLDEMNAIIDRKADLWQTEEAFLVNTSHLFVTQPHLNPNPSILQHGVHSEAVNRCLAGSSGSISGLDYRSNPALIVYRWLPKDNLCLIVKIDQAEALAPAYAFGGKVAATSTIALLAAIFLGTIFSRSITRPIKALQAGVVQFGQGDQGIRLPETALDELGTLAREFNRMAESLDEKDARLHEYATDLERKVEERTADIKQREERYRSYIEVTGQLGWTTNAAGEVEEDISSWRKYTGQSEEEVKGWGWTQALHPDDVANAISTWQTAITTKTTYEVEYRLRRYDGEYRHFLARGAPVYNDRGEIQEWVGTCIDITERQLAQEALRRFELLSEHSRDIILFIRREDGRILEANTAAIQAYGYSRDELLALTIQGLRSRDTQNLTTVQMNQADAGGILFETVHRRKDGSNFPVEVSSQGTNIGGARTLVSIVRDITERKQAEQEIANLSKFPTENPNPVLRLQNDGQIIYANKASQELLEMWDCEVNGYLPEDMQNLVSTVIESGENKSMDIPCNDKIFLIILVPIIEAGYVNLYGSDITKRKRAEEALQESEAFTKTVLDNLPIGVAVNSVDPTVTFTYMNDNFPKFYRTTREKLADPDAFWEAVYEDPEFREEIKKRVLDDYASGETERRFWADVPIIRKGEEPHFITARNIAVPGKPFTISTVWDVTERKRAEDELHRTLDDLKYSNAELEQFAYVASHDLQEPLRGIAGIAQLLQQRYQGQLDSRADEYITHIVDGTQRMQTLINDLLAYSRIGRRGEPIQPVDPEAALKATLENLNMAIQEYGASITNEDLPAVLADPTQLIQLFQNLIGNALKFRAEQPPQIHIGVTDAGEFWQFSVRDNGIGIELQYFERIFQVFQRLHTRREYKGTGIGLAICKKIVERHGGSIWVKSEFGHGATFYFTLPKG